MAGGSSPFGALSMYNKLIQIEEAVKKWDQLIVNERDSLNLSPADLSALSSWVLDCFQSFQKIYFGHFAEMINAPIETLDSTHDHVVDIYLELDHIINHIIAARKGLSALMRVLAEKSK